MISRVYPVTFKQSLLSTMPTQKKTLPPHNVINKLQDNSNNKEKSKDSFVKKHKTGMILAGMVSVSLIVAGVVHNRNTNPIRKQKKLLDNLMMKIKNTSDLNEISEDLLQYLKGDNAEAKAVTLDAVVNLYPKGLNKDIKKAAIKELAFTGSDINLKRMSQFLKNMVKHKELDNEMLQELIKAHKNTPERGRLNTVQFLMNIKNSDYDSKHLNSFWKLIEDVQTESFKYYDGGLEVKNVDTAKLQVNIASKIMDSIKSDVDYIFEMQSFIQDKGLQDAGKLNLIEEIFYKKFKFNPNSQDSAYDRLQMKLMLEELIKINKPEYKNYTSLKTSSSFKLGVNLYNRLNKERILNEERLSIVETLINMYNNSKSKPVEFSRKFNSMTCNRLRLKNEVFFEKNASFQYSEIKEHIDTMLLEFEKAKNNMAVDSICYDDDKRVLKYTFQEFFNRIEDEMPKKFDAGIKKSLKDRLKAFGKRVFNINYRENYESYNRWTNNRGSDSNTNSIVSSPVKKARTTFKEYLTRSSDIEQALKETDLSTADVKTLKKLYKKLVLLYHPDKAPSGKADEYKRIFQEISEAYEVLIKFSL